ncbi:vitelline membrane outer layer protein 1 [Penaeus vannamei]|uniref:vitelline membrane outer layer protein 1 n=1 Tax=Penaeus vannamei TaxID=6689 RepID=UPI00387F6EFA
MTVKVGRSRVSAIVAAEMWFLRRIMKISYVDGITHDEVLIREAQIENPLEDKKRQRQNWDTREVRKKTKTKVGHHDRAKYKNMMTDDIRKHDTLSGGVPPGPRLPRRQVTDSLRLDNGLSWGDWGPIEYCEDGSFATAFQVKFEPYSLLDTDETAVNAVRLYCSTLDHILTGYVYSVEGKHGDWENIRHCSSGFVTGMRANVLEPQGTLGDDVAVKNVQLACDEGQEVITGVIEEEEKIPDGKWSFWSRCSAGSGVCGIEIRYENAGLGDDAGVTNIAMFCCAFNGTRTN